MTPTNTSGASTDIWSKDNLAGRSGSEHFAPCHSENSEESHGVQGRPCQGEGTCPICKGAGFVHPLLDSGQPDFSRVVPCQCEREKRQGRKLQYLKQYSNLGSLSRFTFGNLSPKGKRDDAVSQERFSCAYQVVKTFADNPQGWLVLFGPSGCGKTHLACAIANYCLSSGQPAFYIGVADLLDHLRSAFSPTSNITYDELFEHVKNTPLLVLDDLTMESATSWAKEKLEQLLNHRFNARLATVVTTDVPLEKFGERLHGHFRNDEFCQVCAVGQKSSLERLGRLPPGLLRNMTFDNFDYKRLNLSLEQRQNLQQAFHLAVDFAHNPEGWLILSGVNGCGKTHLAAAITNYRFAQGKPTFFVVVPELLDHLRSTFSPESRVPYDEFFEEIKQSPLLILDDFGEQSATSWAQEKLYQLINHRYNTTLPMVVTTCLSLDEIETRISSRMVDPSLSLVFNIIAPDYRGDVKTNRRAKRY
ncbi:MAG TPA: ATP-binding protein [Dehalococcoidia bacterium]|nr:ATP-binding protein [Dehalococcoidia bacterium]